MSTIMFPQQNKRMTFSSLLLTHTHHKRKQRFQQADVEEEKVVERLYELVIIIVRITFTRNRISTVGLVSTIDWLNIIS